MKLPVIFKEVARRHGYTLKAIRTQPRGPRGQSEARREAIFRAAAAGIPYPEIAAYIGRKVDDVRAVVCQHGKRHGKRRSQLFGQRRMVVEVGGVCWFTAADCAAHYGVGLDAVHYHLGNGTLDRLGQPRRGGRGGYKPLRLGLFTFPSRTEACAFLGLSRKWLNLRIARGRFDEIKDALRDAERRDPVAGARFREANKKLKFRALHDSLLPRYDGDEKDTAA